MFSPRATFRRAMIRDDILPDYVYNEAMRRHEDCLLRC